MVAVRSVSSEQEPVRQANYALVPLCSTDEAYSVRKTASKIQCAALCTGKVQCIEYSFHDVTKDCSIYRHKPVFYEATPGCSTYRARYYYYYYYYY